MQKDNFLINVYPKKPRILPFSLLCGCCPSSRKVKLNMYLLQE